MITQNPATRAGMFEINSGLSGHPVLKGLQTKEPPPPPTVERFSPVDLESPGIMPPPAPASAKVAAGPPVPLAATAGDLQGSAAAACVPGPLSAVLIPPARALPGAETAALPGNSLPGYVTVMPDDPGRTAQALQAQGQILWDLSVKRLDAVLTPEDLMALNNRPADEARLHELRNKAGDFDITPDEVIEGRELKAALKDLDARLRARGVEILGEIGQVELAWSTGDVPEPLRKKGVSSIDYVIHRGRETIELSAQAGDAMTFSMTYEHSGTGTASMNTGVRQEYSGASPLEDGRDILVNGCSEVTLYTPVGAGKKGAAGVKDPACECRCYGSIDGERCNGYRFIAGMSPTGAAFLAQVQRDTGITWNLPE